MHVDYTFNQIAKGIFHIQVKDPYDLAMLFLRVQEYYESPYKKIRNKMFSVLDFMKIYSKKFGGNFTYATDWGGFNIPGKVMEKLYVTNGKSIPDWNFYDDKLKELHDWAKSVNKLGGSNYYVIGTRPHDKSTLDHELCHAYFSLSKQYKKEVLSVTKKLSEKTLKKIKDCLIDIGYSKEVMEDEIQAYLTNDLEDVLYETDFTFKEEQKLHKASEQLKAIFDKFHQQYFIKTS